MNIASVDKQDKNSALTTVEMEQVQKIVELWKQSFQSLKTLQVVTDTRALVDNGANVDRRLRFRVNFVYDSPHFYSEIKSADKSGVLGAAMISAFDSRYYYSQSLVKGEKVVLRSTKPNPNGNPYITGIPLLSLFAFVFGTDDSKDFESLKNPKVWKAFVSRITQVENKADNSLVIRIENKYEQGNSQEVYEVNVKLSDVPSPTSWTMVSSREKDIVVETIANDSKNVPGFVVPFPTRLTQNMRYKNTLMNAYESVVQDDSIHVNEPVNADIFSLENDKNAKVIDE